MKLYNSDVKVLKLVSIPENGDLMFSLANPDYTSILVGGKVQINYAGISEDVAHVPTDKAAIGVDKDGMTLLVEVEGHGVTVRQLANVMLSLGAVHAVYTPVAVIKTYELLELEAVQVDADKKFRPLPSQSGRTAKDMEVEIVAEDPPKTKRKKKVDVDGAQEE